MANFTNADRIGGIGGYIGGITSLLGLLNPGGIMNNGCCSENTPVTRYELGLQQTIASQDSKISLLEADKYTDQKIADTYAVLDRRIREMEAAQNKVNMEQAVYNGVNTATLNCMQGQIAQLYSLTKFVVPNTSVCPGWGNVTITPAAAPTTGA